MRAAIVASVPSQVQPRAAQRFDPGRCRWFAVRSTAWRAAPTPATSGPRASRGRSIARSRCCSAGARALLMQAAHPLVVAGANQTGMYERNPWKRLQRTLILTYTITFGTKAEAHAAADKINEVHTRINGIDPVTGQPLRRARSRAAALRPRMPGRLRARCSSSSRSASSTTRVVSGSTRSRCSRPSSCLVPRDDDPADVFRRSAPGSPTSTDRGELQVTEGARRVLELFLDPPEEAEWRPVLRGRVAPRVRHAARGASARCTACRCRAREADGDARDVRRRSERLRPLLPPKYRFIAPYTEWRLRQRGIDPERRSGRGPEAGRHPPLARRHPAAGIAWLDCAP